MDLGVWWVPGEEVAGEGDKTRFPLWITTIAAFGLFFLASAGYHFWQLEQGRKAMEAHAKAHASMVAGVVGINAEAALLAKQTTEEIIKGLLENTARFVLYLDQIEPFSEGELSAFSRQAGLAGIVILRAEGSKVAGPSNWLQGEPHECSGTPILRHMQREHLYLLRWGDTPSAKCIAIGIEASRLEALQGKMGLPEMLSILSKMPGMVYLRAEDDRNSHNEEGRSVLLKDKATGKDVMEISIRLSSFLLRVGVDADYLTLFNMRIRRGFLVFNSGLAVFGAFLSLLLYMRQKKELANVRAFERELSKAREDAALGRAAASISHEIRNALNAVTMGIQRLEVESPLLASENRRLLELMSGAVARANSTVTGLLKYARPPIPRKEAVSLDAVISECIELYRNKAETSGIRFFLDFGLNDMAAGDSSLLAQVVDNLIRNALEAQERDGFVSIATGRDADMCFFRITNPGFRLPATELPRIIEPYFTTKTGGTGLGLSIANRIVNSHGGRMVLKIPKEGYLEITCYIPLWKNPA